MAKALRRLPVNAPGEFFVDDSCIDCDTCRQIAPAVFGRSEVDAQSYVTAQPETEAARMRAAQALVACPTSSIGTVSKFDIAPAVRTFPELLEDGVHYCGFAAASSYGASSYLIVRPGGNVLVDSPRAARPLLGRMVELGGVKTMFLTHKDDVADHAVFRARFECERVMHAADVTAGMQDVERKLDGTEPVALADDLLAIPVPGHTRGSMALLYRQKFLFTGDHLWWSAPRSRLHASRSVAWYSWAEQRRSLEKLLSFRFEWVLPGHGGRHRAISHDEMHKELTALTRRLPS
jgi:glyoxylase-like metal-dependent hydrolase (beta-lactamase superfamily II)/ferredoxin